VWARMAWGGVVRTRPRPVARLHRSRCGGEHEGRGGYGLCDKGVHAWVWEGGRGGCTAGA
jgi:hypothetical protein